MFFSRSVSSYRLLLSDCELLVHFGLIASLSSRVYLINLASYVQVLSFEQEVQLSQWVTR